MVYLHVFMLLNVRKTKEKCETVYSHTNQMESKCDLSIYGMH